MRTLRALLAFCLAAALAVLPVMALALDARMHGSLPVAVTESGAHSGTGARIAYDGCDMHASPDEDANRPAGKAGHCGACCLAHTGFSLPMAAPVAELQVVWSPGSLPDRVRVFDIEHRSYGLKRPPRA